jgi:toxin-antitoxin system PIN domain toxin
VFLIDVNILVYAHMKVSPYHERAREWLDGQLNRSVGVGMPWLSLLGFLRISTNKHAFIEPQTVPNAVMQMKDWLAQDGVWIPETTQRHVALLEETLSAAGSGGNAVSDAHLAALAIDHGLTLCSNDGDFSRFKNLRWINPLAA